MDHNNRTVQIAGRWPILRSLARYVCREYPGASNGELARWLALKVTPALGVPPEKRPLGDRDAGETLLYAVQAINDARHAEKFGVELADDTPFSKVQR